MVDVVIYTSTSIVLPPGAGMTRQFKDARQHLPGRAPLEAKDYSGFDTHALFHDVYVTTDGRAIEALGPPLVNLARSLLPIVATLDDGRRLIHKRYRHDRVTVHRFVPERGQLPAEPSLQLRFANGSSHAVSPQRSTLDPVRVQFTTLQKDNPPEWILDWLTWLALIGVERVLLYDNGSANRNAVLALLRSIELPLSVVWIDWAWPYGPVRSHYNNFAQATQNNHAHRCLGHADWTGHFDIDEYPVGAASDVQSLLDRTPRRAGTLRLDSCWVPDLREQPIDRLPRFSDFPYRERTPRGKAHKYLVRNRALRMAKTHNANLRIGWFRCTIPSSEAMFLHYKPLTTHWRNSDVRGTPERLDATYHVEDRTIIDRLHGLAGVPALTSDDPVR